MTMVVQTSGTVAGTVGAVAPTDGRVTLLPGAGRGVRLSDVLDGFPAVTLGELERVALLNRTDTKFVLPLPILLETLPSLASEYRLLEIGGVRLHRYRTVYFDTPDFALYHQHHAGRAVRQKVRSRAYLDSGLAFLEVKTKTNKGSTVKHRRPTAELATCLDEAARAFVAGHVPLDPGLLAPRLRNDFRRITLVDRALTERVTIDIGLRFAAEHARAAVLPGLAVVELKRAATAPSDILRRLRAARVQPGGFSKYCVGVALLHGGVKKNLFKPKLRDLAKLGDA
jgi:hypothetical protein